jgi:hypothetical protein
MASAVCSACRPQLELEALPELEAELEGELEAESELEGVGELEAAMEMEISPIRKIYPDAAMEHLGELAAEAETEQEAAEHFLPLIGMAASKLLPVVARAIAPAAKKALPRIARAVTRVTPQLTKGIGKIARGLHRRPGTRPLLRAVPAIARRTVHSIARQAAQRRLVTPRTAVRTLAKQTQRVLGTPRQRAIALRRHQRLDRTFHGQIGRGMARPHVGYIDGAARGYPRVIGAPAAAARPATRVGRVLTGQCFCPPCPACGTALGSQTSGAVAPSPAYCRCCGQLLRQ